MGSSRKASTAFELDFDGEVKWAMQMRVNAGLLADLRSAEAASLSFSHGQSHALKIGDSTYEVQQCEAVDGSDVTLCALGTDWNDARATEVGVVKLRSEVKRSLEERYRGCDASASPAPESSISARLLRASGCERAFQPRPSTAATQERNTEVPKEVPVLVSRERDKPPAQGAKRPVAAKPVSVRAPPARIEGPDRDECQRAAREAASRGILRHCVMAVVSGDAFRARYKAYEAVIRCYTEVQKKQKAPSNAVVDSILLEVSELTHHRGLVLRKAAAAEFENDILPSLLAKAAAPPPPPPPRAPVAAPEGLKRVSPAAVPPRSAASGSPAPLVHRDPPGRVRERAGERPAAAGHPPTGASKSAADGRAAEQNGAGAPPERGTTGRGASDVAAENGKHTWNGASRWPGSGGEAAMGRPRADAAAGAAAGDGVREKVKPGKNGSKGHERQAGKVEKVRADKAGDDVERRQAARPRPDGPAAAGVHKKSKHKGEGKHKDLGKGKHKERGEGKHKDKDKGEGKHRHKSATVTPGEKRSSDAARQDKTPGGAWKNKSRASPEGGRDGGGGTAAPAQRRESVQAAEVPELAPLPPLPKAGEDGPPKFALEGMELDGMDDDDDGGSTVVGTPAEERAMSPPPPSPVPAPQPPAVERAPSPPPKLRARPAKRHLADQALDSDDDFDPVIDPVHTSAHEPHQQPMKRSRPTPPPPRPHVRPAGTHTNGTLSAGRTHDEADYAHKCSEPGFASRESPVPEAHFDDSWFSQYVDDDEGAAHKPGEHMSAEQLRDEVVLFQKLKTELTAKVGALRELERRATGAAAGGRQKDVYESKRRMDVLFQQQYCYLERCKQALQNIHGRLTPFI